MMLSKRNWLKLLGVTAVVGALAGLWRYYSRKKTVNYPFDPRLPAGFTNKLFIPIDSGPFGVLDIKGAIKIRALSSKFPILPGLESPLLLYETQTAGKTYQNPIFRIESGARFTATLENALSEPTIIHWHGLHTPATMDGHPKYTVSPGAGYEYDFKVGSRGGTYWYHTHAHGLTAKQAYSGLASFFLVEDEEQRKLSEVLDLKLGITDLPLVIQDKRFDVQGKLLYQPDVHDSMMGWLGDIVLANLTPNAVQVVTLRTYRLRLLNGSNARIYRLAFVSGMSPLNFTVIGTDGGLIDRPETVTEAYLAPGERLDILFDAGQAKAGTEIFLKSLAFDAMENEGVTRETSHKGTGSMMGGMGGMGNMGSSRLPMGVDFNILKFSVTTGPRLPLALPKTLSQVKVINLVGAMERKIELSMDHMRFLINGRSFSMDEIAFDVKRGTTEIWRISNPAIGMPHPMHLHGFSFQVLERLNSPPQVKRTAKFEMNRTVCDLGWKDTVLVWLGETVRIAIDFTHDFPGNQIYLFHCHNLEHEDGGMMINYRVLA
jgi:blue copper oxidase